MNFSNNFKICWWTGLLIILSVVSIWRLLINSFTDVDILIFIFWFILVLFPIISEISIFGVNIKKDLENFKNEIKNHIADIKNVISVQPMINITTTPADKKEYERKTIEEIKEDVKEDARGGPEKLLEQKVGEIFTFSEEVSAEKTKITDNQKIKDRLNKITTVERSINEILRQSLGRKYKSQMKITDSVSGDSILVDGVIYRKDLISITEIVEIKFITKTSFDSFYYIASKYIRKIFKFGLRIPVRFIVVSEDLDERSAYMVIDQITKINFGRRLNPALPRINIQLFLFKNGKLSEIKI